MDVKIVRFKTDDGIYLNGFLKHNNNTSKKVIIAIHGMACSCFSKRESQLSEHAINCGIDSFIFNNRGSEIIKYLEKSKSTISDDIVGGSACENIYECYYDIKAAINLMLDMGYEEIYLCGHSLGATKLVYSYYKFIQEKEIFLDKIKAIILLSFVDLNSLFTFGINFDMLKLIINNLIKANHRLNCKLSELKMDNINSEQRMDKIELNLLDLQLEKEQSYKIKIIKMIKIKY